VAMDLLDASWDDTECVKHGWLRRAARGAFLLLCLETIFAVPYRSVFLATHSAGLSLSAGIVAVALGFVAFVYREKLLRRLQTLCGRLAMDGRDWFGFWLVFGVVIRVAWAWAYPMVLAEDATRYFSRAQTLAETHTYAGTFFPPGFSLFLTPFFAVFGASGWVTALCGVLTFAGTYWMTFLLAKWLGGMRAAGLACALVAVWPNYVALVGSFADKETLLVFLVMAMAMMYLHAGRARGSKRILSLVVTGILLGCAVLTQPAFLLFPMVIFGCEILRGKRWMRGIGVAALVGVVALATVSPWSYRNYRLLHRFVLVSTNGGSVFYRANNPLATGAYEDRGAELLPDDEFAASAEGYRAGREWIRGNPAAFAALAVRKQVGSFGDDGIGVYETMKRHMTTRRFYAAAKLVCNVFWWLAWGVLLIGSSRVFRSPGWGTVFGVCFLPLVLQWAIETGFESEGRHHVPYVGLVSVLVAVILVGAKDREVTRISRLTR
jgi:4-amino-4-deoxy-L-arabinose transferase-like glycosyltransferase